MGYSARMEFLVSHLGIRHFFQDFTYHHYSRTDGDDYTIGLTLIDEPYVEDGEAKIESWSLEISFTLNEQGVMFALVHLGHWKDSRLEEQHDVFNRHVSRERALSTFSALCEHRMHMPEKRMRQYSANELTRMIELATMVNESPLCSLKPA